MRDEEEGLWALLEKGVARCVVVVLAFLVRAAGEGVQGGFAVGLARWDCRVACAGGLSSETVESVEVV